MYRIFCESVKNFFIINREGEEKNEFRLRIAQPIKGFADKELYNKWKREDKQKFQEVSNLVYEINENKGKFHSFETFSRDLWGYGYEAIKSNNFPKDIIREQLKLIDLLLSMQYWVEL